MPEKRTKVQHFLVEYICDSCGEGVMRQVGNRINTIPLNTIPQGEQEVFHHQCVSCGEVQPFRKKYPCQELEEMKEEETNGTD